MHRLISILIVFSLLALCVAVAASVLKIAALEILKVELGLGEACVTVVSASSLVIYFSSFFFGRFQSDHFLTAVVLLSWAVVLSIQSSAISRRHALKLVVGAGAMAVVNVWAVMEIVALPAFLAWYS